MGTLAYPHFTVIMRGYTFNEADAILQALEGFETHFSVEMTLNTKGALDHISELTKRYGHRILIGAGTVRSLEDAKNAKEAGAKFLLGPHKFTQEIIDYAKTNDLIVVPAAMTPSEINEMFSLGADIVKVFPADAVSSKFFKDVQAPLGKLPLMAVGGVNADNAKDFLNQGASYVGIGSGMFNADDIKNCSVEGLRKSLENFILSAR